MTDERYALPDGWVWAWLGSLTRVVGGGTPRRDRGEFYEGGTIPWATPSDIDLDCILTLNHTKTRITELGLSNSSTKLLPNGTVLLSSRASIGKIALAGQPMATNQGFANFIPSDGIEALYLAYCLKRFTEDIKTLASGTTYLEVSKAALREFLIPVPPLLEQRRIVGKIQELFEQSRTARAALDHIPPLLKKFRQSVLAAAFRGDLTRDWREQNPDAEPAVALLERIRVERRRKWEKDLRTKGKDPRRTEYKQPPAVDISELSKLPEQWAWTNVGWLAGPEPYALVDGPFGSNLKTADYVDEGVRVVRLQNIGEGEFKDADWAFISREKYERLQRHSVHPGNLIIATLGDPVARVCRLPIDHPTAIVKADCIRFKVDPACAEPLYVMWALNTTDAHKRAELAAHGVGRLRVNLNEIKQLPVPLAPLLEQQQITARVEVLFARANAIEEAVGVARRRAGKLEQSILARAFRGELVPQDPNDEPASTLMARIKTEQTGTAGSGRPTIQARRGK